ncbi:MAG: tetratricopeptide repeat protein [Bauldia sp.]
MSDIFREVDEDIRREQYKKLWDRYGIYVIGLAVIIVVATAGYRGWVYWQEKQAQTTGDRFAAALALADAGNHADAEAALAAIVTEGSGGYPTLARFRIASEKASAGDKTGAVAEFDKVAADSSTPPLIKDMARLRAALILTETASLADLQARIGDLAATGNPWRSSAREFLGLAAWRAADYATAQKYYRQIADDEQKPRDIATRTEMMLSLLRARLGAPAEEPKPEG